MQHLGHGVQQLGAERQERDAGAPVDRLEIWIAAHDVAVVVLRIERVERRKMCDEPVAIVSPQGRGRRQDADAPVDLGHARFHKADLAQAGHEIVDMPSARQPEHGRLSTTHAPPASLRRGFRVNPRARTLHQWRDDSRQLH